DLRGVVLAVSMDPSDALFDVHRIPWEVEVKEHARELKVDALPTCRGADEHFWPILLTELPLRCQLGAVVTSAQNHDPLAWLGRLDLASQQIDRAQVGREDDDLLCGILPPKGSKSAQQLGDFRFACFWPRLQERSNSQAFLREGEANGGCSNVF